MNVPLSTKQANDTNRGIKQMLGAMILVIILLGLLLFYAISQETDAVSVLRKSADHTDCRSDISTDTYQQYWRDVAKALDGSLTHNVAEVTDATEDMKQIPLIKQVVASSCPPPIGNQK